jgi:hypothetical protein
MLSFLTAKVSFLLVFSLHCRCCPNLGMGMFGVSVCVWISDIYLLEICQIRRSRYSTCKINLIFLSYFNLTFIVLLLNFYQTLMVLLWLFYGNYVRLLFTGYSSKLHIQ